MCFFVGIMSIHKIISKRHIIKIVIISNALPVVISSTTSKVMSETVNLHIQLF